MYAKIINIQNICNIAEKRDKITKNHTTFQRLFVFFSAEIHIIDKYQSRHKVDAHKCFIMIVLYSNAG